MLPVAAQAAEADSAAGELGGRWGVGWSTPESWPGGGPTLRLRAAAWQLGVAGRPSYNTSERMSRYAGLDGTETWDYSEPNDYESQVGWVRLELGHDLWRRGRLSLGLLATGSYYLYETERVEIDHVTWSEPIRDVTHTSETRQTVWGVGVGLRPRYVLLERLSIDFDFGFSLRWWDEVYESWGIDHGLPEWEQTTTRTEGTTFETVGGWGGFGSLNLIFWF